MPVPYLEPIKAAAAKYNLDYKLVLAFVQTESNFNPWAVRYEPEFYKNYSGNMKVANSICSADTEKHMRSASFGLMQIMGQTARELGFTGPYIPQLCDPATGLEFGCKLLRQKIDKFWKDHGNDGVISAYNAGSPSEDNQNYVTTVKRNWAAYRARTDI